MLLPAPLHPGTVRIATCSPAVRPRFVTMDDGNVVFQSCFYVGNALNAMLYGMSMSTLYPYVQSLTC